MTRWAVTRKPMEDKRQIKSSCHFDTSVHQEVKTLLNSKLQNENIFIDSKEKIIIIRVKMEGIRYEKNLSMGVCKTF